MAREHLRDDGLSGDRAAAFGRQLVEVHDRLRDELDRLRDDLAAGVAPTRDLAAHCVAFCSAITRHHTAEDAIAFPELAAAHPELAPVLDELAHDHTLIADVLRRVTALDTGDRDAAVRELDGLSAILDSHFSWEERRLVAALDALPAATPPARLFGV